MAGNFSATPLPTILRRKRRSFKLEGKGGQGCVLVGGKRVGPEQLKFHENPEKDFLFADRERENFVWIFMRHSSPRVIPSWTGFNITIQDQVPVMKSSVHYLDCIDSPATEKTTIYQVTHLLMKRRSS